MLPSSARSKSKPSKELASSSGKQRSSNLLHVDILLPLFFDPANGGNLFLRNVNGLLTDYRSLFSGRQNSS
jgi:hypothetical protein